MLLNYFSLQLNQAIVLFMLYSFLGWIIEASYRSFFQKRFVNAGFLFGPFTPIYGIGAFCVIGLSLIVSEYPFYLQALLFAIVMTFLEFIVGYSVEKIFGFKLWDYTENWMNYKGIICPKYVLLWTGLSLGFIFFIHPFVYFLIERVTSKELNILSYLVVAYFVSDTSFSIVALTNLKEKISMIYREYITLSSVEIKKIFENYSRLLRAFPDLGKQIEKKVSVEIHDKIDALIGKLGSKVKNIREISLMKKEDIDEFNSIVNGIAENPEYQRLKDYYHHSSTIYDHIMEVAFLTYRVSKALKMDHLSATRGALLHDFFCYDWRNHDLPDLAKEKFHGFAHPKIALQNAEKHFHLNDIERDIIVKHMWPLTVIPPRYRESYVVTFADKYVASREYAERMKDSVLQKIKSLRKIKERRKKVKN